MSNAPVVQLFTHRWLTVYVPCIAIPRRMRETARHNSAGSGERSLRMRGPYCILNVLGDVLDDGELHFVAAARTLKAARRRVRSLGKSCPGEYVIYNPQTGERLQRVTLKEWATLIFVNSIGRVERLPCLVVDRSHDGFRLSVRSGLRQGQLVDLVLDEDPSKSVRCGVAWIGDAGSKQEGQARLQAELQTVQLLRPSSPGFWTSFPGVVSPYGP